MQSSADKLMDMRAHTGHKNSFSDISCEDTDFIIVAAKKIMPFHYNFPFAKQ